MNPTDEAQNGASTRSHALARGNGDGDLLKVHEPHARCFPMTKTAGRNMATLYLGWAAKDFDPDSLRTGLPKAVSLLEWAISKGKGKVYVHCTAGLGRAPAVAIAYLYWFCGMNLNTAYEALTSKRPCGPSKRAIRGATYDLSKNDPWKEPFESLPDNAFEDIADWERNLIWDRCLPKESKYIAVHSRLWRIRVGTNTCSNRGELISIGQEKEFSFV
ncbi:phosphoglucan phosphatase LSF2 [Cucumis melo var. makuwa]|uniref:Phosphoglucan phosphatase LSF2 n=1 Tax=Cucumis melo var. makuwa TaxID=1194695 RepID=A0A5D3DR53_CUCMM|nr:phosphoglucan phosphatase LSF2 [Cucumis melo var. makuwa]